MYIRIIMYNMNLFFPPQILAYNITYSGQLDQAISPVVFRKGYFTLVCKKTLVWATYHPSHSLYAL